MAPACNRPPSAFRPRLAALACGLSLLAEAAFAVPASNAPDPLVHPSSTNQDQTPQVLLSWLDLSGVRPIQMRFNHEITYQAATRSISVERSDWEVRHLEFRAFSGTFNLTGQGRIRADAPDDIATTFTLRSVDLVGLMRQLQLPRTGEIEARLDGDLVIGIRQGEWDRVQINLTGQPGTVRVSRRLLKEFLVDYLQGAVTAQQLDDTLGAFFGSDPMIPLDNLTLEGNLTSQALTLKLPLQNEALNILIEPRIERNLLWEIWNYVVRNLGLDRIAGISTSPAGGNDP